MILDFRWERELVSEVEKVRQRWFEPDAAAIDLLVGDEIDAVWHVDMEGKTPYEIRYAVTYRNRKGATIPEKEFPGRATEKYEEEDEVFSDENVIRPDKGSNKSFGDKTLTACYEDKPLRSVKIRVWDSSTCIIPLPLTWVASPRRGVAPLTLRMENATRNTDTQLWYIDGELAGFDRALTKTISEPGNHTIKLEAKRCEKAEVDESLVTVLHRERRVVFWTVAGATAAVFAATGLSSLDHRTKRNEYEDDASHPDDLYEVYEDAVHRTNRLWLISGVAAGATMASYVFFVHFPKKRNEKLQDEAERWSRLSFVPVRNGVQFAIDF